MTIRYLPLLAALMLPACADTPVASTSPEPSLAGHVWTLVEVNGQPVAATARPARIIFDAAARRYSGSGGCNAISGGYALEPGNRIHFIAGISTRMACQTGMDVEGGFLNALSQADSYTLNGGSLTLERSDVGALARLEAGPTE